MPYGEVAFWAQLLLPAWLQPLGLAQTPGSPIPALAARVQQAPWPFSVRAVPGSLGLQWLCATPGDGAMPHMSRVGLALPLPAVPALPRPEPRAHGDGA